MEKALEILKLHRAQAKRGSILVLNTVKEFDEAIAEQTELKQIIQNQSNLLEMYSKDNEVPNNALLIEQLKAKDECVAELKECCEIYKENTKSLIEAHEEIIRDKDKRIEELENKLKPKTCEGCKWHTTIHNIKCFHRDHCQREHKDLYQPKDNA